MKLGIIDQNAIHKHKKWKRAGWIKNRFPNVKCITFKFLYEDEDHSVEPFTKIFTRYPEHSAFFEFDCPFRECIGGGHDLSVLKVTIKGREAECTGKVYCEGWADKERIGKHHCLCRLSYIIQISYMGNWSIKNKGHGL